MMLKIDDLRNIRALHIGGYWRGENDIVLEMMLGLQGAGITVFEYNTDKHPDALDTDGLPYFRGVNGPVWLRTEHLKTVIDDFKPNMIICNAGGLSFRPAYAAELRSRLCLLGIALSDPDVFETTTSKIAPNFDLYLTISEECIPRYRANGVNAHHCPPGTHEKTYHPHFARPEYECDVLVFGSGHANRAEPVRALFNNFETHVHGEGWEVHGIPNRGMVSGDEALSVLSSARITVVFGATVGGYSIIKPYIFDHAAAGALVATDFLPALERYFVFDRELIGFRSVDEMTRKIRHYLDHPEEAEKIRLAGHNRVLREHTWTRVWPKILSMACA
jgi:hypothetical protein